MVRNYAIAANPDDWKIHQYGFVITKFPNVLEVTAIGCDTITEFTTSNLTADTILASGGKGKLILTLLWPGKLLVLDGIKIQQIAALSLGTDREDLGSWLFNDYLQMALEDRSIVGAPKVEIVRGGIGTAQKLMNQLKAGVSGRKLVVKVD